MNTAFSAVKSLMALKSVLMFGSVIGLTAFLGYCSHTLKAGVIAQERLDIVLEMESENRKTSETLSDLREQDRIRNQELSDEIGQLRQQTLIQELSDNEDLPICSNCRLVLDELFPN